MENKETATDEFILRETGARLMRLRLAKNITQAQLATQAGISKRTLERIEAGSVASQITAFIRVCRALGLLERFNAVVPEPAPSPMEQLHFQGRQRRRARGPVKYKQHDEDDDMRFRLEEPKPGNEWKWGDEK